MRSFPLTALGTREEAEEKKRQAEESAGATSREKPKKRPGLLGSCHAHAPWSEVVERNWPDFFDPDAEDAAAAKLDQSAR